MIAQIVTMGQIKRPFSSTEVAVKESSKLTKPSTPYFERNSFIKEEVNMQELSSIHDLGFTKMTQQDVVETKAALNVIGYNPTTKLINLLIENDVLGFSRPGVDNHPHLNFLTTLLPRFKREAGVTHIALSLPKSLQKLLDVFVATGEILPTLSPINLADYGLKGDNDFVALLKAARLVGYQLVAIEPDNLARAFDPQKEQSMAKAIQSILKTPAKVKVIFLAHDRHLGYASVGDWMPVAGILKEAGIHISTVNQYWHADFMPKIFSCLLKDLVEPVAFASKDVKMFAALQSRSLSFEHVLPNNWDMTIIYPKTVMQRQRRFKQTIVDMTNQFKTKFQFGKKKRTP
jgi:hypothetical protein